MQESRQLILYALGMSSRRFLVVMLLLGALSICSGQQVSNLEGTWVLRSNGQNLLKLTLAPEGEAITGSWTRPRRFSVSASGEFTSISPEQRTNPVEDATWEEGKLRIKIDDRRFVLSQEGGRVLMQWLDTPLPPWRLERVPDGEEVVLATSLPQPDYPAEIVALQRELHDMVEADQARRNALDEAGMIEIDEKNRSAVLRIFDQYGWVKHSLAGTVASHEFWLLVQHQTPEIQQRLLPALAAAAQSGEASKSDYAYLYDRVQMGLDKPQRWGTQAKCENGKPVLYAVEDPDGLDARRSELSLPPIDEYLKLDLMVEFCAQQSAK